jgi:hypothetical protein
MARQIWQEKTFAKTLAALYVSAMAQEKALPSVKSLIVSSEIDPA